MVLQEQLQLQIEQLRLKMYQAFKYNENYDEVVKISQELDKLLNKLENLKEEA